MTIRTSRPAETTWVVEINMRRFNVQIIKDLHASRISSTVFICAAAQIFFDRFTVEAENERDDASRERSQVKKRKGQHRVFCCRPMFFVRAEECSYAGNTIVSKLLMEAEAEAGGKWNVNNGKGEKERGIWSEFGRVKIREHFEIMAINRRNNHFYKMSRY